MTRTQELNCVRTVLLVVHCMKHCLGIMLQFTLFCYPHLHKLTIVSCAHIVKNIKKYIWCLNLCFVINKKIEIIIIKKNKKNILYNYTITCWNVTMIYLNIKCSFRYILII